MSATQPDLFDFADGEGLKRSGMSLAADAEEGVNPGWSGRAIAAIVAVAREQPTVHVNDVLKRFAERPAHYNAWGQVWSKAIKQGVIAGTGMVRTCHDARKHKHASPVYRSLIFGK